MHEAERSFPPAMGIHMRKLKLVFTMSGAPFGGADEDDIDLWEALE
jgi:hypothetical protein